MGQLLFLSGEHFFQACVGNSFSFFSYFLIYFKKWDKHYAKIKVFLYFPALW